MEANGKEFFTDLSCNHKTSEKKTVGVHFDGWSDKYDYWCSPAVINIHPSGEIIMLE